MGDKRKLILRRFRGTKMTTWKMMAVGVEFNLLGLSDQHRWLYSKKFDFNAERFATMTCLRNRRKHHSRTSTWRHKAAGFIMRETITEIIAQLIAEILVESAIFVARSKVRWLLGQIKSALLDWPSTWLMSTWGVGVYTSFYRRRMRHGFRALVSRAKQTWFLIRWTR